MPAIYSLLRVADDGRAAIEALPHSDALHGSIGPKCEAARAFVLATGRRAAIGSLDRIEDMPAGQAGTQICTGAAGGAETL